MTYTVTITINGEARTLTEVTEAHLELILKTEAIGLKESDELKIKIKPEK